jgi:hypothetical protein
MNTVRTVGLFPCVSPSPGDPDSGPLSERRGHRWTQPSRTHQGCRPLFGPTAILLSDRPEARWRWRSRDYADFVCGRATSTMPRDDLVRLLSVDEVEAPELPASWNVAPTQPVYAVTTSSNGVRKLRALRWGR